MRRCLKIRSFPEGSTHRQFRMGLVEEFIARYRMEFDFYDQAARLVAQTLEVSLQAGGIRSIVTSRPKSVLRLEAKARKRATDKSYASVDDIYNDIVDLAGARVALYFPGERHQVDTLVKSLFVLNARPKEFHPHRRRRPTTSVFRDTGPHIIAFSCEKGRSPRLRSGTLKHAWKFRSSRSSCTVGLRSSTTWSTSPFKARCGRTSTRSSTS